MANPHEMVVPDYTTVEYTEARAMFTAEGKSDHEAATILANVWRFNNTHARQLWDRQQEEAEQDWLAERTRRSELAEQERITREEEEELAKREERKKYKTSTLQSPTSLYQTPQSSRPAATQTPRSDKENTALFFTIPTEAMEIIRIFQPAEAKAKNCTIDEDLTWEEFSEANIRMLGDMKHHNWDEDRIDMLSAFYRAQLSSIPSPSSSSRSISGTKRPPSPQTSASQSQPSLPKKPRTFREDQPRSIQPSDTFSVCAVCLSREKHNEGVINCKAPALGSLLTQQCCIAIMFPLPFTKRWQSALKIDRWGRRPLLISGTILMGFFLCLVGGLQGRYGEWGTINDSPVWIITNHDSVTKGIIVCSYLFVCSFAVTLGPVTWTYPAEIFPMKVRAKAVSVVTATNWVFGFALAWAVPPALSSIAWKTYFIFAAFNFTAAIHFIFCFPETAQRTLEEIEEVFSQGHTFSAWAISRDVGKRDLEDVVGEKSDDEKRGSLEKV
ncbi:hypothetical protein BU15DRAFT_74709 [Melanogaster broomeanus]|nr:hypothetical protein BU15DRAFT_74709 [Melanogaster broomeanus]